MAILLYIVLASLLIFCGFITNNLVSKLKMKEEFNKVKLDTYKQLLRTWVISRNVIIGYMLVRRTREDFRRRMASELKLDEASVSSSALIAETCLYCTDKHLINSLIGINDLLFLKNNWFDISDDEINTQLEVLKTQVFKIFSELREEIETSSMVTFSDIKSLFINRGKPFSHKV